MKNNTCNLLRVFYGPGCFAHTILFNSQSNPRWLGTILPYYTRANGGSGFVLGWAKSSLGFFLRGHSWWAAQLFFTPSFVWLQILCSSGSDILPRLQCIVLQISFPAGRACDGELSAKSLTCQWHSTASLSRPVLRHLKPDFQKYSLPSGWLKKSKGSFRFLWHLPLGSWVTLGVLLGLWWWY